MVCLHNLVIVSFLLLGEYFGEIFLLDFNAKLLPDDLHQDLLDFWSLKYVLGCVLLSCLCDVPEPSVFATFSLREKEEEDEREDLHNQGAETTVWGVQDGQAFIKSRLSENFCSGPGSVTVRASN